MNPLSLLTFSIGLGVESSTRLIVVGGVVIGSVVVGSGVVVVGQVNCSGSKLLIYCPCRGGGPEHVPVFLGNQF